MVVGTLLFLRPDQILHDPSARWPQKCVPDTAAALGPCADGEIRDEVPVNIEDDGRTHSLLESGFEVVKLRPPGMVEKLERLRREGLSGAESPGAAVSTSPAKLLLDMVAAVVATTATAPPAPLAAQR